MHIDFDRNKSLEVVEGEDWGEPRPEIAPSNLVQRVYKMRRQPLDDLTAGDIRTLVGQDLSLEYVMPLAIDLLQKDPWEDNGSLLRSSLGDSFGRKAEFWQQHHGMWDLMTQVLQQALFCCLL